MIMIFIISPWVFFYCLSLNKKHTWFADRSARGVRLYWETHWQNIMQGITRFHTETKILGYHKNNYLECQESVQQVTLSQSQGGGTLLWGELKRIQK